MRYILFIFLFQYSFGQLHHSTISSQAGFKNSSDVVLFQTVGQISSIGNYVSNKANVIQGFQQPLLRTIVISNPINLNILVYPNPVSTEINFQFNNINPKKIRVEIFDINGKFIEFRDLDNFRRIINLQNLITSEYIIRLLGEGINYSTKIIKK